MGSQSHHFNVKSIAIIGAGPSGISAAKYLRAQSTFDNICIFEQRDQVGGVWNYTDLVPKPCPLPQEDPFLPPDEPIILPGASGGRSPIFPSPMYQQLHTNIPGQLMHFGDTLFEEGLRLFPGREEVLKYLLKYAEDVRQHIKFCFQVQNVKRLKVNGVNKWHLEAHSTLGDDVIKEVFDAVVVANGHYATPFIPNIKNISTFADRYPSSLIHSKHYRAASSFKDKKVIVVGNGPSGLDIALQINRVCKQPVILSVRQPTSENKLEHIGGREVLEIEEFLVEERGVRLRDGTVETNIDAVVLCTGFLFSYPFLTDLKHELITNGKSVHGLYKHLFQIDHPTLVFPVLNMKAVPWPLSEVQAAVYSAVWSNNLELPSRNEMVQWSQALEKEKDGQPLHVFKVLEDGKYINEMHDWAMTAKNIGKKPPYWNRYKLWQRAKYAEAKLRFEQQECKATTLEELGLHYDLDDDELG